jgi:hypothetical protein
MMTGYGKQPAIKSWCMGSRGYVCVVLVKIKAVVIMSDLLQLTLHRLHPKIPA